MTHKGNFSTVLSRKSKFSSIIDVGGGTGLFLEQILAKCNTVKGTLFELPHVIEKVKKTDSSDLLARCDLIPGDFFERVPPGADVCVVEAIVA